MHGPTNVKFHNDVLGAGISHIVQINATQPTDSLVTCIMSHCLNSQPRVVIHIIILYDCNEFKLVSVHDEQVHCCRTTGGKERQNFNILLKVSIRR